MPTHNKQYLGATADLLKKLRSGAVAWTSWIGPSIVWSMSPLWVEYLSSTKGVLMTIFLVLKSSFFPPFSIYSFYKLYNTMALLYLLFESFLTVLSSRVSPFANKILFSSTLSFVSKLLTRFSKVWHVNSNLLNLALLLNFLDPLNSRRVWVGSWVARRSFPCFLTCSKSVQV